MIKRILLFLFIVFVFISNSYCQDSDPGLQIIPFFPSRDNSDFEQKVKTQMSVVVNLGFRQYLAIAEDDLSLCDTSDCRSSAQGLLDYRYVAEGRCDSCKDDSAKEVCRALKNNNCNTLKTTRNKAICNELLTYSETSIDSLWHSVGKAERASRGDVAEILGVYWGFKNRNYLDCQRFLNSKDLPLKVHFMCKILFATNPSEELEKTLRDLALFNIARNEKKTTYCDSIKNQKIKNACLDVKIRSITEIP